MAFESVFEIEVDQVNEPPSAIYLVKDTIEENLPKDTLVGPLVAPDPDNIPADGLILRYTFDDPESLGTESVNNRHAEVHGNVTSVEGKIHGAASFPGDKASYMEVPSFEFGGPVSVSTWVRYQKFNSYSRIMDFGNGAGQDNLILSNVSSGAGVTWHVRRSTIDKYLRTGSFAKGVWTHVVTTVHESGQLQLFLDGLLVGTNNSGHAPRILSRSHQLIGLSNWSSGSPFQGEIDDFMLYDRALSATEVEQIYLLTSGQLGEFTYRLVSGKGDTDNKLFYIEDDRLYAKQSLDYETQPELSIRVEARDEERGTVQQALTVKVRNANDAPHGLALDNATIVENAEAGKIVGLLLPEDVDLDSTIYSGWAPGLLHGTLVET